MWPKVSQGVTTVVIGNCGISVSPISLPIKQAPSPLDLICSEGTRLYPTMLEFLCQLEKTPPTVNYVVLIGHMTLRVQVMKDIELIKSQPASKEQIEEMKKILKDALDSGASGFSTGLGYALNSSATTEEVVTLTLIILSFFFKKKKITPF